VAQLLADSMAAWVTFRRALPDVPLTFRETALIRGATYLLALVSYGVGQGGMAWFLHRRHGVPLSRAAGAIMLTAGVNMVLMGGFALLGVALGSAPSSPAVLTVVLGMAGIFPVYLGVIALRPPFLTKLSLLRPLFDAGLAGHGLVALARLPHVLVLLVAHFVAMRLFDIQIGLGDVFALLPLVFVVGVLPISPSGLGTSQAMAILVFAPFATGATEIDRQAAVLAYSLGYTVLALVVEAILGLVFLIGWVRAADLKATEVTATPVSSTQQLPP
jgi:hypothetical protein